MLIGVAITKEFVTLVGAMFDLPLFHDCPPGKVPFQSKLTHGHIWEKEEGLMPSSTIRPLEAAKRLLPVL